MPTDNELPIVIDTSRPRTPARSPRKKPGVENMLAAIMSFFVPGLGQFCQGRTAAGVMFLVSFIVGAALCAVLVGIPIVLVTCIWAAADAAQA